MAKPKAYSMPNLDIDQKTFACLHRLDQHSSELMLPIIPIVVNVLWLRRLKFFLFFVATTHFSFDKSFQELKAWKECILITVDAFSN